jgi:hypothetical protein
MANLELSNLRLLVSDALQKMESSRGKDPLAADLNGLINWAYKIIARKCCLAAKTPITLVNNQNTYNLRDTVTPVVGVAIIRPVLVWINANGTSTALYDANQRDFGLWTIDELTRMYPSWINDGQNPPTKAVFLNFDTLLLHPTPDATTAGNSGHFVFGQYMPADLVSDSDVPALPEEIHEAIGWLAAQLATTPTASDDQAWARIAKYSEFWTQIIQEVADANERNFQAFGASHGYYFDDLMIS